MNRQQHGERLLVFGAADHVGGPLAEQVLGRKPTTLKAWLEEHRDELL